MLIDSASLKCINKNYYYKYFYLNSVQIDKWKHFFKKKLKIKWNKILRIDLNGKIVNLIKHSFWTPICKILVKFLIFLYILVTVHVHSNFTIVSST